MFCLTNKLIVERNCKMTSIKGLVITFMIFVLQYIAKATTLKSDILSHNNGSTIKMSKTKVDREMT